MNAPNRASRSLHDHRALGLVTLGVAAVLLAADFSGAIHTVFSSGGRTVRAVFANSQQLRKGDLVRIQGVDVGKVTDIKLDPGARSATVSMSVADSAGPLYADARATLRWRTVLGASYAVVLDRGTPNAGRLAARAIPESRTSNQVELEAVMSADQGGAKTGLQTMPGELAKALRDPMPPARALGTLADVSPAVAQGVGALRGQQADTDLRSVVAATAAPVQALDAPNDQLRSLVAGAAATLQTTAGRQADIRSTIAQAPGVLRSTDATVRGLDTTLALADPLIAQLRIPAPDVGPTVAQLHPTLTDADRLLHHAVPLVHALRPAVASLASAARAGGPLLVGLTPSIDRVNGTILPFMGAKDPQTQHSAAEMVGGVFTALGSGASGQMDGGGHFIRFPVTVGSSPAYLPCQTYIGNPDASKLIECQSLQQALKDLLSYNPLGSPPKAPGSASQGSGR
jgi:phospholipid/cholesterol/gamma-HCH transport system substrate-binding protein